MLTCAGVCSYRVTHDSDQSGAVAFPCQKRRDCHGVGGGAMPYSSGKWWLKIDSGDGDGRL